MGKAKRDHKARVRSITVDVVDKLPKQEDSVCVAVTVGDEDPKFLDPDVVAAIDAKVKKHYGDHVLVIILGPGEKIEQLNDREMNLRGWVRLPGHGIHEN